MKVKDLLDDAETGDRSMEHLKETDEQIGISDLPRHLGQMTNTWPNQQWQNNQLAQAAGQYQGMGLGVYSGTAMGGMIQW